VGDPLIDNDAVVLGILLAILALIFRTSASERPAWRRVYRFVAALLLGYFVPGVLGTAGVFSGSSAGRPSPPR
jgi:uncharacterized membrane protein YedE/YeeE